MSASVLECASLAVSIAGRSLCQELSFCVRAGECWAVLGPNGAGKTTLLTTLAGLRTPAAGTIRVHGRDLAAWPHRALARERALLPQTTHDELGATVLETALAGRHPHLGRWQWEGRNDMAIAQAALDAVELTPQVALERSVLTLSGGERQRLAIAGALAQQATLLLLDEPTAHLDLRHQVRTLDLLVRLARDGDKAIVVTLHDVNLAARFCDYALFMRDGQTRQGPRTALFRSETLEWLYEQPMQEVATASDARPLFFPR